MKIALKVSHIFLVAYAAVQLVDVWEDLVVRELAIGQGKDHHYQVHSVLLLEAPLHSHRLPIHADRGCVVGSAARVASDLECARLQALNRFLAFRKG